MNSPLSLNSGLQNSNMFLTHRQNKTAYTKQRPRFIVTRQKDNFDSTFNTGFLTQRPFTTSLGRNSHLYSYRKVDEAQEQMSQTFKQDLNSYVKNKFKMLTNKHNQTVCLQNDVNMRQSLNNTISNPETSRKWSRNKPRNVQQMRICGMSYGTPVKIQKIVGEPYLVNAKQQLARILTRKKQSQAKYQNLQKRVKEIGVEKLRIKKQKDRSFRNPQHVTNVPWDAQWRSQTAKQTSRYRLRLASKHKKASNSMTIQW